MMVPVFCSMRENIWTNHWDCMASWNVSAGCSGTLLQIRAISISSALRCGSFSLAAISRGQARMPLGPNDDRVAHGDDGFQERLLFDVVHRAERVQRLQALLGFLAEAFEALLQHLLVVVDPLEAGPEGGGFVDDEPRESGRPSGRTCTGAVSSGSATASAS